MQERTMHKGKCLGTLSFAARAVSRRYLKISVKCPSSLEGCFQIGLKNGFLIYVCSIHTKIVGLTGIISQH